MPMIYLYHHLGLGDHIICNGLVRTLAENMTVKLLCKSSNYNNVFSMYKDQEMIDVISVSSDEEAAMICSKNSCLKSGSAVGGKIYPDAHWDEGFYRDLEIPFDNSWTKFYCDRNTEREDRAFNELTENKKYIFVHSTDSKQIDRVNWTEVKTNYKIVRPHKEYSFLDHCKIIEKAEEIHCINSSFIHLVDRLNVDTNRLFYHRNFKPNMHSTFTLQKKWTIL